MKHLTEHEITLANQWYTLDENAIPNEYILQNLTSINDSSYWGTALPSLLRAFDGIRFDGEDNVTDQDGHLLIGQSVTEWEVRSSLKDTEQVNRTFWLHRTFQGGVPEQEDPKRLYFDCREQPARGAKLLSMKSWMKRLFGEASRLKEFCESSFSDYCERSVVWQGQIATWRAEAERLLRGSLSDIIRLRQRWDVDGCGMTVRGELLSEMLHHSAWAHSKCTSFIGRDSLVTLALSYVLDTTDVGTS